MSLSSWSSTSRSLMAILSGNFISSAATQLQNHVFLIPWVKKKMKMGALSCSRGRDYCNSGPVRYVPNNSSGNKEWEDSFSLAKSQSNNVESFETNGESFELSRSGPNSCCSRSSVADPKFQKQHENPIKKINYNDEIGNRTRNFVQSNVERIQLLRSSQTPCMSRTSFAENECQNENRKLGSTVQNNGGLGRGSVVQPNVGRIESTAQVPRSSWSIFADTEFENQSEKPTNNKNNDIKWETNGIVPLSVERIEPYESAESFSGNVVVDPQLPNLNENPINPVKYGGELGTRSNVRSDPPRIKLSESVETSGSVRSFMVDTGFQNQNNRLSNKLKSDVGLGTSRVVRSNVQTIEDSNSEETSCSGRSFVLNTEGLGFGEEFDGGMHFEDYELMEEFEGLSKEKSHEGHEMQVVKIKKDVQKLAVDLLAVRALSALELRKKLQGKDFPLHIVDAVIRDFQARGLINDGLYAETFSRSRWSSSTWGPRRIKKALHIKGVSDAEAEKAIKLVFNDASGSEDRESDVGMSKLSMDHLFAQASKQWMRSSDVSIEKRKSRIIRWLQYRGFSWSIIGIVLKKLESKRPT